MSTHHFKVSDEQVGERLDVFLTHVIPDVPSRSFVQKLIENGHVKINEAVAKGRHKVRVGEDVLVEIPSDFLTPQYIEPEAIPLDVFYEDDFFLIINKPIGMMVHPATGRYTGTLVNALLHRVNKLSDFNSDMRPGIVHRLDQETSGLMVIAKDNITHTKLAKQFARRDVKKRYVALVEREIVFEEGVVDQPIGRHAYHRDKMGVSHRDDAREARTVYKVLKRKSGVTLVALFPTTGRTHQLRVHMLYLGHPVLGDDKYGQKRTFPRLALHAQSLGFRHPQSKKWIEFSSAIPEEFLNKIG